MLDLRDLEAVERFPVELGAHGGGVRRRARRVFLITGAPVRVKSLAQKIRAFFVVSSLAGSAPAAIVAHPVCIALSKANRSKRFRERFATNLTVRLNIIDDVFLTRIGDQSGCSIPAFIQHHNNCSASVEEVCCPPAHIQSAASWAGEEEKMQTG